MNHEITEGVVTAFSSSWSLPRRGGGASRSRSRSQGGLLYLFRPLPWPSHRSRSRPGGEAARALLYCPGPCASESLRLWSGEAGRLCCAGGAVGVGVGCRVFTLARRDVCVSVRPSELLELPELAVPLLCLTIATPRSRAAIASVEWYVWRWAKRFIGGSDLKLVR
jgi:hypothetical protein